MLAVAGAAVGIAAAGMVVSLLSLVEELAQVRLGLHEPLAATLAALGVWRFGPVRGVRAGLLGVAAALTAMLLCDLFRAVGALPVIEWHHVPRQFAALFRLRHWNRLLLYAFGAYVGWHLCSAGRVAPRSSEEGGAT